MGAIITCEKCKKVHRYSSSEIKNIGTMWHPIWTVKSPHCGNQITRDHGVLDLFDKMPAPKDKNAYERAESSDIR